MIAAGSSERLANHKAEVARGGEWQEKQIAASSGRMRETLVFVTPVQLKLGGVFFCWKFSIKINGLNLDRTIIG